jgi:hypothetical protein
MVYLCPELRWMLGRIGKKYKCCRFGDLLRERVVKNQGVVSPFIGQHIITPLCDLVRFAFAQPRDLLKANARQFVDDSGVEIALRI